MTEANKEKALKKILEIAKSVVREESEKMTRADLAEELKKEGIRTIRRKWARSSTNATGKRATTM